MGASNTKPLFVAGNWKMHLLPSEGLNLTRELKAACLERDMKGVRVVLLPPFPHIPAMAMLSHEGFEVGAQDCSERLYPGAYTGEVSAPMLADCGAKWVIVGHSERREHHQEYESTLERKLREAVKAGLGVIYCCGESGPTRNCGDEAAKQFVMKQLEVVKVIWHEMDSLHGNILVAYEPIWAIGTGKVPTPEQAQDMCAAIDGWFQDALGVKEYAIPVLYGGSCKGDNAAQFFSQRNVCGGLIGGASLKRDDFLQVVDAARGVKGA